MKYVTCHYNNKNYKWSNYNFSIFIVLISIDMIFTVSVFYFRVGVSWTKFVIIRVEKYKAEEITEETPWIETTAGIATISVISFVVLAAIVVIIACFCFKVRSPGR